MSGLAWIADIFAEEVPGRKVGKWDGASFEHSLGLTGFDSIDLYAINCVFGKLYLYENLDLIFLRGIAYAVGCAVPR